MQGQVDFPVWELLIIVHVGLLDIVVRVGLALATTVLFALVFLAYLRLKSRKMLLISIGFGVFVAHAYITLPELVSDAFSIALDENAHLLIHTIALVFILLGILKD
jgi:hypothetical protein